MFKKSALILFVAAGFIHQSANATPCGSQHTITSGDSLSFLAGLGPHYSNPAYWDVLYQANKDRIGNNPNLIFPGVKLRIPCLDADGNVMPDQFDEDGNPIESAFDGSGTVGRKHGHPQHTEGGEGSAESHDHGEHDHGDAAQTTETAEAAVEPATTEVVETETAETEATESEAAEQVAAAAPATAGPVRLLTGDDYGLSADRSISNGRVVSKIMDAALKEDGDASHQISWINDWSAHLNPLLATHSFDIGFPWVKPDCDANPTDKLCAGFLFSNPVFEIWMLAFTNSESPITFDSDDDLVGKTLCRPTGYQTSDLDANGRNWLAEGKITLEQPASVQQCFRKLTNNEVDAVVVNEFTGRSVIKSLNIQDKVTVLDAKPVSIQNLYAVVHKDHPRAQQLIDEVNNGIQAIQASGAYQEILASNK